VLESLGLTAPRAVAALAERCLQVHTVILAHLHFTSTPIQQCSTSRPPPGMPAPTLRPPPGGGAGLPTCTQVYTSAPATGADRREATAAGSVVPAEGEGEAAAVAAAVARARAKLRDYVLLHWRHRRHCQLLWRGAAHPPANQERLINVLYAWWGGWCLGFYLMSCPPPPPPSSRWAHTICTSAAPPGPRSSPVITHCRKCRPPAPPQLAAPRRRCWSTKPSAPSRARAVCMADDSRAVYAPMSRTFSGAIAAACCTKGAIGPGLRPARPGVFGLELAVQLPGLVPASTCRALVAAALAHEAELADAAKLEPVDGAPVFQARPSPPPTPTPPPADPPSCSAPGARVLLIASC
jgi:hypothetical protein